MAEYDSTGFLQSYCALLTSSAVEIGKWTKALSAWVTCLWDKYGVIPIFAHVDKDVAEIGTLWDVLKLKIQLCWWHLESAVGDQLKKKKLSTTPYNVQCAQSEFPLIRTSFVPFGKPDPKEHEGRTGGSHDHTGVADSAYLSLIITMNILHPTSNHLLQVTWWHWCPSKWFPFQRAQPPHLAVGKSWQQSCQPWLAKRIRTLGKWSSKLWPMKRLVINVHSVLMNINKQSSTCWNITIVHTHWSQVICTQPLLVSESGLWNKCIITA